MVQITVDVRDLIDVADIYAKAGKQTPVVIARALNHVGGKARTAASRALAEMAGLRYGTTKAQLTTEPARPYDLSYSIGVSNRRIPLMEFNAKQGPFGVIASPLGKTHMYPHTFIVEKRFLLHNPADATGGVVFKRVGPARLPIRKVWGPPLSIVLVNETVQKAWREAAEKELPARVLHEIEYLLKKKGEAGLG